MDGGATQAPQKTAESASSEPKATPLQPAYFDAPANAAAAPEPEKPSQDAQPDMTEVAEPQMAAAESAEPQSGQQRLQGDRGPSRSNAQRGRRRRGGRGRGRSSGQGTARERAPQSSTQGSEGQLFRSRQQPRVLPKVPLFCHRIAWFREKLLV